MAWAETCSMKEKARFCMAYERGEALDVGAVPSVRHQPQDGLPGAGALALGGAVGSGRAQPCSARCPHAVEQVRARSDRGAASGQADVGAEEVEAASGARPSRGSLAGDEHDRGFAGAHGSVGAAQAGSACATAHGTIGALQGKPTTRGAWTSRAGSAPSMGRAAIP